MNILLGYGLINLTDDTGKEKELNFGCVPTTNYCNLHAFFSHFKDIQFSKVM